MVFLRIDSRLSFSVIYIGNDILHDLSNIFVFLSFIEFLFDSVSNKLFPLYIIENVRRIHSVSSRTLARGFSFSAAGGPSVGGNNTRFDLWLEEPCQLIDAIIFFRYNCLREDPKHCENLLLFFLLRWRDVYNAVINTISISSWNETYLTQGKVVNDDE